MKRTGMKRSAFKRKNWSPGATRSRLQPKKARQASGDGMGLETKRKPTRKRMKLRPRKERATPAEKAHMDMVVRLGCIGCIKDGVPQDQRPPVNVHHLRCQYGRGVRASHWETLPLCEGHHQGNIDNTRLAFHRSPRTWVQKYGTEVQLLQLVYQALGCDFEAIPALRQSSRYPMKLAEPPWWDQYRRGIHDLNNHPPAWVQALTQPKEHHVHAQESPTPQACPSAPGHRPG